MASDSFQSLWRHLFMLNSVAAGCDSSSGTLTCCNESSCSDFMWLFCLGSVWFLNVAKEEINIFTTICREPHQPTFLTFIDSFLLFCAVKFVEPICH